MFHSLCSYPFQYNDLYENELYGKMESKILAIEFRKDTEKVPRLLTLYVFYIFSY